MKVKVKYLHPFKLYVAHTLSLYKQVVCIQLNVFLLTGCCNEVEIEHDLLSSINVHYSVFFIRL